MERVHAIEQVDVQAQGIPAASRFAGYVYPLLGTLSEYRRRLVTLQQPPAPPPALPVGPVRCLKAFAVEPSSGHLHGGGHDPPPRNAWPVRVRALVALLPLAVLAGLLRVLAQERGPRALARGRRV